MWIIKFKQIVILSWESLIKTISILTFSDVSASAEVHFESKDGGFFLKHSPRQYYPSNQRPDLPLSSIVNGGISTTVSSSAQQSSSSILSIDKFTVFQTSEPVSVRATYGPFSTKQTVPARYIVPDPLDVLPTQNADSRKISSNATLADVQELGARHLDMSAHVVSFLYYCVVFELLKNNSLIFFTIKWFVIRIKNGSEFSMLSFREMLISLLFHRKLRCTWIFKKIAIFI